MSNDEIKWIHPLARAAVQEFIDQLEDDDYTEALNSWGNARFPYLTDRAKAILDAVEFIMKGCRADVCGRVDKVCDPWIEGKKKGDKYNNFCPYQYIRRAWIKGRQF